MFLQSGMIPRSLVVFLAVVMNQESTTYHEGCESLHDRNRPCLGLGSETKVPRGR